MSFCILILYLSAFTYSEEVDLDKLDTEDSRSRTSDSSADPKTLYPKLVAKAFPKKYKPISKKRATRFMIEHFTGVRRQVDDASFRRFLR